ncbi:MAG TPA: alkaline phosphatase family protein [Candidatus Baltobacteraceae bacterium]|nr:alkaline phosphatase family protein [Candidatus Baltobacteraceae bacterium]
MPFRHFVSSVAALLVASSCAGPGMTPVGPGKTVESPSIVRSKLGRYIKHVVIIVQENRSFDNVFAGFPGADAPTFGYMKSDPTTKVPLEQITLKASQDIAQHYGDAVTDIDGNNMDGFGTPLLYGGGNVGRFAYSYLAHKDVAPYWTMAKRYVLADHMFPTILGPSFTAHLALIASTANLSSTQSLENYPTSEPWGCDAPSGTQTYLMNNQGSWSQGPFPCFTTIATMADTLDAAGVNWKYYAPAVAVGGNVGGQVWSTFDAIKKVRYGPDWTKRVISPPQQILADAQKNALPSVAWVMPDWAWSDHPATYSDAGPSWVAAIVNEIGQSKDWKSTAIFILWDDWGGFFDNVPPPQLDFRGLGIRVPCIIVSPYVRPHVSHTQYEFGSILRFTEDAFRLPRLGAMADGYTDQRAANIIDSFDFTQGPRKFRTIRSKYPTSYFLNAAASMRAPDDE